MMALPFLDSALLYTALGFSLVAAYFDIRTGEIPDKFTIGLVIVALVMRGAFSLQMSDIGYLLDGALVGGIFFAFGAFLFYTGGWGGGDAKLIAGIGAALGGMSAPAVMDSSIPLFPPFFGFFIALSIAAIPYSLAYALILAARKPEVFSDSKKSLSENWFLMGLACAVSLALLILLPPYNTLLAVVALLPPLFYLMFVFTKSVEKIAMQREVPVDKLEEGDMVAEDIVIGGEKLARKRDMDGLSQEALEKIRSSRKAPKTVRIKWGIRFAPAFPIAIVVSLYWTHILGLFF